MNIELLNKLICPETKQSLTAIIVDGMPHQLVTSDGKCSYPIINSIPRFVSPRNYAENFGLQWNKYSKTQLDSHSGHGISEHRFQTSTGWSPETLRGKLVLDAGCGSGRFAEIALRYGAKVIAIDYSSAVDACHRNLSHNKDLLVIQGDIYALPFPPDIFDYVYSLGVLQHTPNVKAAFHSLIPILKSRGRLCVDFYWKRARTYINPKYFFRLITRHCSHEALLKITERHCKSLLFASDTIGRIPFIGRKLRLLVPVVNYKGIYPFSPEQLYEWALLDTFDMLAAKYDNPQVKGNVVSWMNAAGFRAIECVDAGHLVVRGEKL